MYLGILPFCAVRKRQTPFVVVGPISGPIVVEQLVHSLKIQVFGSDLYQFLLIGESPVVLSIVAVVVPESVEGTEVSGLDFQRTLEQGNPLRDPALVEVNRGQASRAAPDRVGAA